MKPTTMEKLTITMLCQISSKLGIEDGLDPVLVEQAVSCDDMWVLGWAYPMMFPEITTPDEVAFVGDVFDMFSFIGAGYAELSPADKKRVDESSSHAAAWLSFAGYDGNNEGRYMSIAHTMVERLDRFSEFKGIANRNSHCPSVERYARMYAAFESMRSDIVMRTMDADEIIQVISEAVHPDNR